MYRPTRFSGKRPKFFAIECNEPFSQYLSLSASFQNFSLSSLIKITYSRMMFKVSTDFTNPWYLTMLGCYNEAGLAFLPGTGDVGPDLTSRFFRRSISSCSKKKLATRHFSSQPGSSDFTIITRNSLLGRSVSLICFTATVSPVFQFSAL